MTETNIDRYGVIGYPIAQSRSPVIHRLFAMQTGQKLQYELIAVHPDELVSALQRFQREGGKGLNVTVPHKSEVTTLVDRMSERAQIAGAVNTLEFRDDQIIGDNTDGCGLIRDFENNLDIEISGRRLLILGAGGATRGILAPILDLRPAEVTIANRTLQKAEALAAHFGRFGPVSACRFESVTRSKAPDIVINATSAGFRGETPPYPDSAVSKSTICYDLSYGLTPTPFSEWARQKGAARSIMGWGMLVEQAAESFRIWRGIMPETGPVLSQMNITA